MLDRVAQRYSQRPSQILGLDPQDPLALNLDLAIMARALQTEPTEATPALPSESWIGSSGLREINAEDLTATQPLHF
jgi:hypothetical protein